MFPVDFPFAIDRIRVVIGADGRIDRSLNAPDASRAKALIQHQPAAKAARAIRGFAAR